MEKTITVSLQPSYGCWDETAYKKNYSHFVKLMPELIQIGEEEGCIHLNAKHNYDEYSSEITIYISELLSIVRASYRTSIFLKEHGMKIKMDSPPVFSKIRNIIFQEDV